MFSESDLQYAAFWCTDLRPVTEQKLLCQFQSVWQFVYSNLIGKCKRKAILEFFGERLAEDYLATTECCDTCSTSPPTKDYQLEMTAILTALQEIPERGEKKVFIYMAIQFSN